MPQITTKDRHPQIVDMSFSGYLVAPGACVAEVGDAGTNKDASPSFPLKYYITFVNSIGETQIGAASNEITTNNVIINLSNIPIGPAGVIARKIYRRLYNYIILLATIDNVITSYEDDISSSALSAIGIIGPIANTTAGSIGVLKLNHLGGLDIGDITEKYGYPQSFMSIRKTLTEINLNISSEKNILTIIPSGESPTGYYRQKYSYITVPVENTYAIGSIIGESKDIVVKGLGIINAVDGLVVSTQNMSSASIVSGKGIWAYVTNFGHVTTFSYGLQSNVDSWGGTIANATAGRFRLANQYSSSTPAGKDPQMTVAYVINANIDNVGSASHFATIPLAIGFLYNLNNGIGGIITDSYGIKLGTPTNAGVLTNHVGIYLASQVVAGSTDNWAIKSMGGNIFFAGNLNVPAITPPVGGFLLGTAPTDLLGFYGKTAVNQPDTVADPSGGGTIDAESRTAIGAIIDRLQELGLIA